MSADLKSVRDTLRNVAPRVEERLRKYGHYGPAECMMTSAVACAEITREGLPCFFQAGTASWFRSRLPEDIDTGMFGYAWEPDHPVSLIALRTGGMPEFHAWCAVPISETARRDEDGRVGYSGYVVDFSAHWFPMLSGGAGMQWSEPPPPFPAIVPLEEMTGGTVYYICSAEASRVVSIIARKRACELIRKGFRECEDLFVALGGPMSPSHASTLDYSESVECCGDALDLIRMVDEHRKGGK